MEINQKYLSKIWLADDDADDCEFFEVALARVLPSASLRTFPDGEKLMREWKLLQPDMLFLDINMPIINGIECLKMIRVDRSLLKLPIVVFSSTSNKLFVDASYGYGANLFFRKPYDFQLWIDGLRQIFSMNWNDPEAIAQQQFADLRFLPL